MLLSLAGAHFFIGGPRASGLAAQAAPSLNTDVWTEIAEPEGMGAVGVMWETWTYAPPSDAAEQTITLKGNLSPVTSEIVFGLVPDDPGQLQLWAAARSEADFAFRIDLADNRSRRFWIASVTAITEAYEAANGVIRLRASLAINSSINRGDE